MSVTNNVLATGNTQYTLSLEHFAADMFGSAALWATLSDV
jgi:hypothetical protein